MSRAAHALTRPVADGAWGVRDAAGDSAAVTFTRMKCGPESTPADRPAAATSSGVVGSVAVR
jgi:hypothetical protein